ncbi:MAG: GldG family protein [Treponema sp.]|nr:GldG family protein [Treponema sp.]
MTKKQTTTITVLVLTAVLLGALVSSRLWFSLDLTENKANTIADVSRNLHNEIADQVQITYYLSDRLKSTYPIFNEIVDMLDVYSNYSRGKIRCTVIDPVKDKENNLTGKIEGLGISPQQIGSYQQDETSVAIVYSGVTIEYLDQIEVLPWLSSVETLEYDLTTRIRAMVRDRPRIVGILLGDDKQSWNEDYQNFHYYFVQAGYQLRQISPGEEIPEIINALIVIDGVETFDEDALYRIDHYIQRGGKVLFAVKGVHISIEETQARLPEDLGLLAMLSSYGVNVLPEIVLENPGLFIQYQTRAPSGMVMTRFSQYPQWINIQAKNCNPEHPVSSRLSDIHLYWASPLEIQLPGDAQLEAAELFSTSENGWSMNEPFIISPDISNMFDRDAEKTRGKKILAVSVSGIFPSWFADETEEMQQQGQSAHIIVVGDYFFAGQYMNMTQGYNNLDFLIKSADWLGNDDDILGIRPRPMSSRLNNLADDKDKEKSAKTFIQAINVAVMPLLVILAGIIFIVLRNSKIRSLAPENLYQSNEYPDNESEDSEEKPADSAITAKETHNEL